MQDTVGFIGVGLMGKPMAANLLKRGFRLIVHSRSPAPVDELVAAGAARAESPEDVARRATRIVTMLPDSPDVAQVVEGSNGMLLARVLRHMIKIGKLTLIDANGKTHVFQGTAGPACTIRFHDRSLHWRMLVNPKLAFGEGWMDEQITCDDGTIYEVLDLMGQNMAFLERHPSQIWREKLGAFARFNELFNLPRRKTDHRNSSTLIAGNVGELVIRRDQNKLRGTRNFNRLGHTHRSKIDHRRHAGEILHQHPRRPVGDFAVRGARL